MISNLPHKSCMNMLDEAMYSFLKPFSNFHSPPLSQSSPSSSPSKLNRDVDSPRSIDSFGCSNLHLLSPLPEIYSERPRSSDKPQVPEHLTKCFWEEEDVHVYQLTVGELLISRRVDNGMVNGTKLLNVANLTRGIRDGVLKKEKLRVVVKTGSMHLKGVWIPLDRARALAVHFNIAEYVRILLCTTPEKYVSRANPLMLWKDDSSSVAKNHHKWPEASQELGEALKGIQGQEELTNVDLDTHKDTEIDLFSFLRDDEIYSNFSPSSLKTHMVDDFFLSHANTQEITNVFSN